MAQLVQLAIAKELAAAGSVRDTVVVGQHGGYTVLFKIGMAERALATKTGSPRLFSGVDAAARVLKDIGIRNYHVDARNLTEGDLLRRRRPDRAVALKQTHENSAYVAFLQERAESGRRDPVRYTDDQVNDRMKHIRARRGG